MNAAAYLTSQGWRGSGHALHPSGNGISKPLLISQKSNTLGVGKKAHDAYADQWWARAFDDTLKSLNGQSTTKKSSTTAEAEVVKRAVVPTRWSMGGGLYGGFVRGEGLRGTMGAEEKTMADDQPAIKKRRLDGGRESRAEQDHDSERKKSRKRTSRHLPSDTDSKTHNASAASTEIPTKVSPPRSNKTPQSESVPVEDGAVDSAAQSGIADGVVHSTATTPNPKIADATETAVQDEAQERRKKKKRERRLKEKGLTGGTASAEHETAPSIDQRIKKKKNKKKRKNDEDP
ncbi:MAG: hypothetical protein Q9169_001130 [Polycauliona sp. 2 TL-2023]